MCLRVLVNVKKGNLKPSTCESVSIDAYAYKTLKKFLIQNAKLLLFVSVSYGKRAAVVSCFFIVVCQSVTDNHHINNNKRMYKNEVWSNVEKIKVELKFRKLDLGNKQCAIPPPHAYLQYNNNNSIS